MALEQAARERDALSVDNAHRTVALMVERVEPLNAPNERAQ